MDGLLLRIAYDLLLDLGKNGMEVGRMRVKSTPRGHRGRRFRYSTYTGPEFLSYFEDAVNHPRYLCSAGDFPVIECIETHNEGNLKFHNSYRWYDLFGKVNVVQSSRYDGLRGEKYASDIARYLQWQRDRFAQYVTDCGVAIEARNSEYVDPCYVDAGYVARYVPSMRAAPVVPVFVCTGPGHFMLTGDFSMMDTNITHTTSEGSLGFRTNAGETGFDSTGSWTLAADLPGSTATQICFFVADSFGQEVGAGSIDSLWLQSNNASSAFFNEVPSDNNVNWILPALTTDVTVPDGVVSIDIQEYGRSTIDISHLASSLASFSANISQLQTVDFSATPLCVYVSISAGALTDVDSILVALDAHGELGGYVDLSGGTSVAPGAAGLTAAANLVIKGWTVTTN